MKLMVVSDSATMRHILTQSLRRIGYTQVVEVPGGREALEQIDASISFIISDWSMPQMSGLEFVRHLRASDATAAIPIIMIATRKTRDEVTTAMDAGADSYLVKPFNPRMLKERIRSVLSEQTTGA